MLTLHITHLSRCLLGNKPSKDRAVEIILDLNGHNSHDLLFFSITLQFYLKYYNVNILNCTTNVKVQTAMRKPVSLDCIK